MFKSENSSAARAAASIQKTTNHFTREQIKQAIASDRIFVIPPSRCHDETFMGAELKNYPYALVEYACGGASIRVADAWRINARGEIFPGHLNAVPVILDEAQHFDQAPAALRRNLIAFAQASRERNAGFVNEPTMRAAQVLSSDGEVWEYVANAAPAGRNWPDRAATALRHVATARRGLFSPKPISLSEVDWLEVASQFQQPTSLAEEVAPRVPTVLHSSPDEDAQAPVIVKARSESPVLPDRKIPPDVLAVLKQSHAQDKYIYLPKIQLDRALYARLDQVLRDMGGKWIGGSRRAHAFETDATDTLAALVETGRYVRPADLGFFPTPAALVNKMLQKANLQRGMRVLEPQAGTGNIACTMAAAVGGAELVTVCELMERNVKKLVEAGFQNVIHGDFLRVVPDRTYSAVCMNPPFSHSQDIDHVLHASRFVKPGGTVTSYMSASWLHSNQKKAEAFKRFLDAVKADVENIDNGAFRESGTNVATTLVHFKV